MADKPEPAADEAFAISLGAARAHGCCRGWRPAGRQPTAEIIDLAKARAPIEATEEEAHDRSTD